MAVCQCSTYFYLRFVSRASHCSFLCLWVAALISRTRRFIGALACLSRVPCQNFRTVFFSLMMSRISFGRSVVLGTSGPRRDVGALNGCLCDEFRRCCNVFYNGVAESLFGFIPVDVLEVLGPCYVVDDSLKRTELWSEDKAYIVWHS